MKEITIKSKPQSIEEFTELRNELATTPEGGASILILALLTYLENKELGLKELVIALDKSYIQEGGRVIYKGYSISPSRLQFINDRFRGNDGNMVRSLILGTSVNNNYAITSDELVIRMTRNPYSGEDASLNVKVFVECSGADSNRPITLARNDKGLWKAKEFSSLLLGVKPPVVSDDL